MVIKYRKGKSNVIADCLIRPPITLILIVMSMQGYDTTTWPQLYQVYNEFSFVYQQLQTDKPSTNEYFQKDTLLYKIRHICVPTGDHRQKLIWDAHYNKTAGIFEW